MGIYVRRCNKNLMTTWISVLGITDKFQQNTENKKALPKCAIVKDTSHEWSAGII
jgi:hypothetical protein